jgi:hypothetical protein
MNDAPSVPVFHTHGKAGTKQRGRPKADGRLVYLGRLRVSTETPSVLLALIDKFQAAEPGHKQQILMAALIGGLGQATAMAEAESDEADRLLDDLLGEM